MMKRFCDFLLSLILGLFGLPVIIFVGICVKLTSEGPIFHWSKRVGINNKIFLMPKFRTMKINTPQVATHLLNNPDQFLTSVGKLLRMTSLDELPQLYSILIGDMSFVGPRPALFNQEDLIQLRTKLGIHKIRPGLTGWAQINGRDELPIPVKVQFDEEYLKKQSLMFDIRIFVMTVKKVLWSEGVNH